MCIRDRAEIIDPQNHARREAYRDLLMELRKAKGMTREPVSYTHLDVYKRQDKNYTVLDENVIDVYNAHGDRCRVTLVRLGQDDYVYQMYLFPKES